MKVAAALFAVALAVTPAYAVVIFDLTLAQALELRDLCKAEDGTWRPNLQTSPVANCCSPGNDWCVICTTGTVTAPTGCVSIGILPKKLSQ